MADDELDNLISDSLGGVESALDSKDASAASQLVAEGDAKPAAAEAVRELQQGPAKRAADDKDPESLFQDLVKTFEDESFQKAMADVVKTGANPPSSSSSAGPSASGTPGTLAPGAIGPQPPPGAAEAGAEEFLGSFLKSFDTAVGSDPNFEKTLTTMMTSMLSNDLICEPLKQIADGLGPWLNKQKGLPPTERSRYESQLGLYKKIIDVYGRNSDPLPESAREEVQNLLSELHTYGQPPDEVMKQIAPKDAENPESFEDFMKTMGLNNEMSGPEADMLKKLADDPEELTKAMKELTEGMPDEACKQQ